LRGVFHCAGILDDGIIQQQSAERFKGVMAPKVRGAWNLNAATRELQLDDFLLFSSAAAILGSPGQAGYTAANACLDALSRQRVAQGLPAMSIGWGPWADAGMAAESLGTTHAELVRPMTPALAIDCMERVLDGQQGHIAVVDVAFDMWSQVTGNRSAFLSEVLPVRTSAAPTVAFLARAELDALPDGERARSEEHTSEL